MAPTGGGHGHAVHAVRRPAPGRPAPNSSVSAPCWGPRQGQYDAGRSDNFDSAADFAANDIFALRPELKSLPKRIDCGTADNLLYSVTDYVKDLPGDHEGGFQAGGHDAGYWRSILPEVLSFLGSHLA